MGMNRQLAETRKFYHPDKTDRIETRHQTARSVPQERVVPTTHLVELAGQIEGVHDLPSRPLSMIVDHAHDGFDAPVKRTGRAIRLQFIVLDKVNASTAKIADDSCRLLWTEADARFDDRTDQRPFLHPGKAPCSRDAKSRSGIDRSELARQTDVEQAQPGHRFQFK